MPWLQIGKVSRDLRGEPVVCPRYGTPLGSQEPGSAARRPRNARSAWGRQPCAEGGHRLLRAEVRCYGHSIQHPALLPGTKMRRRSRPQMRELERDGRRVRPANLILLGLAGLCHTDDYYEERAAAMARATTPYRICFKDVRVSCSPRTGLGVIPNPPPGRDIDVEYHAHWPPKRAGTALLPRCVERPAAVSAHRDPRRWPIGSRTRLFPLFEVAHLPGRTWPTPRAVPNGPWTRSATPGFGRKARPGYHVVPGRRMTSGLLNSVPEENLQPSLPSGKSGSPAHSRGSRRGRARAGRLRLSDRGDPVAAFSLWAGVHERNHGSGTRW